MSTQARLESGDTDLVHEAAAASNHVHGPTFSLVGNNAVSTPIVHEQAAVFCDESLSTSVPWASQSGTVLRVNEQAVLLQFQAAFQTYTVMKRKAEELSESMCAKALKKTEEATMAIEQLDIKNRASEEFMNFMNDTLFDV